MKLIFVVKKIAIFIECAVFHVRCDDGIEGQIVQAVIGLALVIILFVSIHNVGIVIPHNQLLSKSQLKPGLFRANASEYFRNKAVRSFQTHLIFTIKKHLRYKNGKVRKIFRLRQEKNCPLDKNFLEIYSLGFSLI